MIICPQCNTAQSELILRGPVLIAEGVVELDDENRLIAVSPLKATQTIRLGAEVDCPDMMFSCRKCKYTGALMTYRISSICVLTGQPTEFMVDTYCGRLPVIESREEDAIRIFSQEYASWDRASIRNITDV